MDEDTQSSGDIASALQAAVEAPPASASDLTPQTQSEGDPAATGREGTEPGPIPYARFADVNRRMQAAEQRANTLAWAERYKPEDIENKVKWYDWADRDPDGFYDAYGNLLRQHPVYGPRHQQRTQQAGQPVGDAKPGPDLITPDGRKVYSADRQEELDAWRDRQSEQRYGQREQQILSRLQPLEALIKHAGMVQRSNHEASDVLKEAAQEWGPDLMKAHGHKIVALMETDGRVTFESACRRVLVPALRAQQASAQQQGRSDLLTNITRKATATTANPSRATASAPSQYREIGRQKGELAALEAAFKDSAAMLDRG